MRLPERVETDRLVLRRWRPADRDALADVWSDPAVWSSLQPGRALDAEFAASRLDHHLRHWAAHGFGVWAVEDRASGELAGWAGPSHPTFVPELADRVEIGWTLRRAFWGRGLATEAAHAAVAAAFANLGIDELISLIHAGNGRSIAVARRLGMCDARGVRHPALEIELRVYTLSRS